MVGVLIFFSITAASSKSRSMCGSRIRRGNHVRHCSPGLAPHHGQCTSSAVMPLTSHVVAEAPVNHTLCPDRGTAAGDHRVPCAGAKVALPRCCRTGRRRLVGGARHRGQEEATVRCARGLLHAVGRVRPVRRGPRRASGGVSGEALSLLQKAKNPESVGARSPHGELRRELDVFRGHRRMVQGALPEGQGRAGREIPDHFGGDRLGLPDIVEVQLDDDFVIFASSVAKSSSWDLRVVALRDGAVAPDEERLGHCRGPRTPDPPCSTSLRGWATSRAGPWRTRRIPT